MGDPVDAAGEEEGVAVCQGGHEGVVGGLGGEVEDDVADLLLAVREARGRAGVGFREDFDVVG